MATFTNIKFYFSLLFFSLSPISEIHSQILSELEFIRINNPILKKALHEDLSLSLNEPNEVKLLGLGLIRFYQNFISSQQNNEKVCTFSPSCSRFGYSAINKVGVFYGVLLTSDRLMRCHGFSHKHYSKDPESRKYIDPIVYYSKLVH